MHAKDDDRSQAASNTAVGELVGTGGFGGSDFNACSSESPLCARRGSTRRGTPALGSTDRRSAHIGGDLTLRSECKRLQTEKFVECIAANS